MAARREPELARRGLAITGLGTFTGARVAERLLESDAAPRVVALDLRLPRRLEGRVRFHRVDLTEPTADSLVAEILEKEGCEALLHAAFFTDPNPDLELSHELEVVGALHVMNAAAAAGLRKLVVASTAQVYGPHPDNPGYLSEAHPLRPQRDAHALRDRAEMEGLLRIFAQRHRAMCVTSLRPAWVLGPSLESSLTRRFEASRVITLMGYDPLLQFLHEDDWIDAVELALERDAPGAWNLAGEGVLPLSTLLRLAGKSILPLPHPLLYRLTHLESLARTGDPPAAFYDHLRFGWLVDTRRAREELGFEPLYSSQEAWMSFVVARRLRGYR
ncbi:MAG TPA: NAD-dependent epimerase/dehydratase family protein [Myxococcota bacterium]|nr:NAD-dependent epimerase/dehydratase family protein [Myxococcota bacterium]